MCSDIIKYLSYTYTYKKSHTWKKWGTPQNFFLAFTDELEKQIIIKKTVEMGQLKTK